MLRCSSGRVLGPDHILPSQKNILDTIRMHSWSACGLQDDFSLLLIPTSTFHSPQLGNGISCTTDCDFYSMGGCTLGISPLYPSLTMSQKKTLAILQVVESVWPLEELVWKSPVTSLQEPGGKGIISIVLGQELTFNLQSNQIREWAGGPRGVWRVQRVSFLDGLLP